MSQTQLDVAILGGGMAGNLLARQLIRRLPNRRIGLFEKKLEHTYNVGESMVELASNYFVRRLGLGSYLYDRQYPKNGLRFFFDSSAKDTPLHEMSELGSSALPFHPAFQVDRSRLETDLIAMNAQDGVRVHRGERVQDLELRDDGRPHRFRVSDGSGEEIVESRWVVDASGRSRVIAKLQGLEVPETELQNASIWGWFEGVSDIDEMGPPSFRERVRHAPRRLSTLHFLYRGYWIWFIPLQEGMTSIGVVCDRRHYDTRHRSKDGFLDFLRQHAAVASLLENAKPIQTMSFPHLAYGTRRFFSPQRWGLVGEASAFPDPFYSPGADFIALANDFVSDLIARDLEGEDPKALRARTELYDEFMRFRLEAAMRLYRDQYSTFGSYELCKLKWDFDVGCYYNLWISQYMRDLHLDARALKRQLAQRNHVLTALSNFAALFRKVDGHLSERGTYERGNAGAYTDGQDCLWFMKRVGLPRTDAEVLEVTQEIFNRVHSQALDLLEDAPEPVSRESKPLGWFLEPRELDA
jgi:flavin-dependent dehydrogenase